MSFFASGPEVRASFPRSWPRSRWVTQRSEACPRRSPSTLQRLESRCPGGRSRCLSTLAQPPLSSELERQSVRLCRARPRRSRSTQIARYRGECGIHCVRLRIWVSAPHGPCVRSNNSRVADRVPLAFQDQWRSAMSSFNVGFVIFPDLTQLDFTGPLQVLARLPQSATHIVAKSEAPVRQRLRAQPRADAHFRELSAPRSDLHSRRDQRCRRGDRRSRDRRVRPPASGWREVCHLGLHRRVRSRYCRIAQGATGDDALGLHGSLASRRGNVREGQGRKRRQRDHRGRGHRGYRFRSECRSGDCG